MNELTILVIEDDKTIQNFLKISLQTKGYKYILADNGLSGISYFYADNPDLILLDLGLPDIDGMEVLRQVRQKSEVPIIIVSEFELDSLKIDFEKRKIFVHGQEIHLTPIEYKMMTLLVNNSGKVLTHHYIQNQVWGYDTTDDYQSLRVFMANIRRKIEDDTANPRFILTEVGVGYRFADE